MEEVGVWPDGLLDAYIAVILRVVGDATSLDQRPLRILPVLYSMMHLEGWFRSWVPDAVYSAGGGGSSVEALSGTVVSDVHVSVADVMKSFDTVDRRTLDRVLSSMGLPALFRHAFSEWAR